MGRAAAAAFRLSRLLVAGGWRKWITAGVFALPALLFVLVRLVAPPTMMRDQAGYSVTVVGLLMSIIAPFMGVFWGSAAISDEIEGKTLVYLWTRPTGKVQVILFKVLFAMAWLTVLLAVSLVGAYSIFWYDKGFADISRNSLSLVWDMRALALGGIAYTAAGFLLGTLFKKPLGIAFVYILFWDSVAQYIPGFLKLTSLRHYMIVLGSNPTMKASEDALGFLVSDFKTPEFQAWVTLLVASVVMLALGCVVLLQREFLGDEPARTQ